MTARDADVERRVQEYVLDVFPDPGDGARNRPVHRLDAGENHDVYRVALRSPGGDVVVRIATSERASDCVLAEREAQVLKKVRGIAGPMLHDFRCRSAWFDVPTMCMQFVEGAQRPPRGPEDAQRLGAVVGAVHALPVDDLQGWAAPTLTLADYLDARIAKIDDRLPWVRDPLPPDVQRRLLRARTNLEQLRKRAPGTDAFRTGEGLVLLHGDVAGGNLVRAPTPVLIDWEYARRGDAADEVAYIFNQNDFGEAERLAFWLGYLEGSHKERGNVLAERVRWWEPVTVLGSCFFWVEAWSRRATADQSADVGPGTSRGQGYYREHAMRRLERSEALLQALDGSAGRR